MRKSIISVSYTHLDVYKRQQQDPTVRETNEDNDYNENIEEDVQT